MVTSGLSAPPPSVTSCAGVLVSDFYAACHHYDGPRQRYWVHLLRDIHNLLALYPKDQKLARWAGEVHQLWSLANVEPGEGLHPPRGAAAPSGPGEVRAGAAGLLPTLPGRPRRRYKTNSADASKALSRSCLSSWRSRRLRRITTRPKGACGPWQSAARSAADPARSRAPRARWRWLPSSAPDAPRA